MPCLYAGRSIGVIRTLRASREIVHNRDSQSFGIVHSHARSQQLPGPTFSLTAARAGCRTANTAVCRAQKQEEKEKDMVGGFDVDAEPGFLESEAVGLIFRVSFVALVSAGVAAILLLARPVIDNTIQAFPYRTSGGSEQGTAPDPKALIPGLESGDSQKSDDSIF